VFKQRQTYNCLSQDKVLSIKQWQTQHIRAKLQHI
jgi:hypothetical protein